MRPWNPPAPVKVAARFPIRFAVALALACTIAALAAVPSGAASHEHGDALGDSQGRLDLAGASFTQDGPTLTITIRTAHPIPAGARPGGSRGTLCVNVAWGSPDVVRRRLCVIGRGGAWLLHDNVISPTSGRITARHTRHRIVRQAGSRLTISAAPALLGLPIGLVHFNVRSTWNRGAACAATPPPDDGTATGAASTEGCPDALPDRGTFSARVWRAVAAGCTPGRGQVSNGPRGRKVVALTFDDGPSTYTPGILRTLSSLHARATFFQIGQQIPGQGAIERQILAAGNAIGNHTWSHASVAGGGSFARGQLSRTSSQIISTTGGYHPCVFRPPYGATSGALVSVSGALGMTSVIWDVDTNDWQLPGTAAVISRAVGGTRPGSIVLMHDGGGPRAGTAAAVGPIVRQLRAKGYSFVTVPELLGLGTRWRLSKS